MLEDVTEAIEKNKNPAVKLETMSFLARFFSRSTPQMLDKKMLKAYVPLMLKALNDSGTISFVSSLISNII
jgi:cytoskeleton-associated protein 5